MNRNDLVSIRVGFALLADAISRLFNLVRIAFFATCAVGVLLGFWQENHQQNGKWVLDLLALGILGKRLVVWVGILRKGGGQ